MTYTALAVLGVAVSVLLDMVVLRTKLLRHSAFWTAYAIMLCFQLVVNGVLTGRRIVTYNAADVLGGSAPVFIGQGRFAYAPVEDLLFGFALVLQSVAWWVWWGRRAGSEWSAPTAPAAGNHGAHESGQSDGEPPTLRDRRP